MPRYLCPQQQLGDAQVLGAAVERRRLGTPHRVCTARLSPMPAPTYERFARIGEWIGAGTRASRWRRGDRLARARRGSNSTVTHESSVISNCAGRCVFCCMTIARDATRPQFTNQCRVEKGRTRDSRS
jgi:hypothetical protein